MNVLVLVAHADDEVLGVGGTVARHCAAGDSVHVAIAADCRSARDHGDPALSDAARQAATLFGVTSHFFGFHAMTLGFVVVANVPVEGRLLAHERHHVRQAMAWGPLFLPTYLLLSAAFGYRRHPMERAARRAAGEPD